MTLKELLARGYSPDIAIGSLAGAGTLGFLIPPSTVMIMYGVLANESVLRLFTAGFLPGMLLASVFGAFIMIRTTMQPDLVPESERALRHMPLRERFAALRELAPATVPDPLRSGLDVWRYRHPVRGGGARGHGRLHRVVVARRDELAPVP